MYCEVNNLHYSRLQAQPHANYSGNITITLPATSGTLALLAQKANFTDVTASTLTVSGNISADTITVTDITATGSASTIGAVAFTSTSATITGGLTVTGAVTASNITVVGSASTIGALAITTTSATLTGDLSVSGSIAIEKNAATTLTLTRTNSASNFAEIEAAGGNGEQLTIKSNVSNQIGGFTAFDVGGSERMRIDNAGGVGINTTSITSGTALEVAGNMRITTTGNGLIFPDGSKQTAAASAGIGIGKAIAMTLVFG
jgi:hypothetical protein